MRILLPILILILFPAASVLRVQGLTPGPDEYRACPLCRQVYRETTIASGNTFGARSWTDGWRDAPMLPDRPPVVRCGGCGEPFWRNEARVVPAPETGRSKDTLAARPEDLRRLLVSAGRDTAKEKTLRTRLWWLANASRREGAAPAASVEWTSTDRENLVRLTEILDERQPGERLRKAEAFRELGRFDEAGKLVGTSAAPIGSGPFPDLLRDLVARRTAGVAPIPADTESTNRPAGNTDAVKPVKKVVKRTAPKRPTKRWTRNR